MPITKEYTTEAKLNTFLNTTVTPGSADDAINEAVDIIDKMTDRNFIADTVATARRFDGNDLEDLPIDECIEITVVKQGTDLYGDTSSTISEGGSGGYYPNPRDYAARGKPITAIHLRGLYWVVGYGNHEITAKWGYSEEAPEAIVFAATILAAGIYNYNRGNGGGTIKSEKIGNYSVSYENEQGWDEYNKALAAIQGYRKYSL